MKRKLLITAGATRNPIDSMRYISANASGKTGLWLAKQACSSFDVHVLGSALAILQATDTVSTEEFFSTDDLLERMRTQLQRFPEAVVIHSAAVGDFKRKEISSGKISSGNSITLELIPTAKILDQIKNWAPRCFLVSFKAASPDTTLEQLLSIAEAQAKRTQSDIVFANIIGKIHDECILIENTKHTICKTRTEALNLLSEKINAGS
jgi:phosphopantothenoylcysteine decarboxylase/phosphopantothenate--cysteine ligase